jgi:hypothetical protein
MKALFPVMLLAMLAIISCSKESNDSGASSSNKTITYPDSAFYGKNILTFPDTVFLVNMKNYGMAATLQSSSSLTIILTNLSTVDSVTGDKPVWNIGDNIGWSAGPYTASGSQTFTAFNVGNIDLQIMFLSLGSHGSCRVDFYENSTAITRSRYLKWK